MALSPAEEAQTRELLAQQAAILSLADSEAAIISNLGSADVSLSQLPAATSLADADLMLVRQGATDKSVSGSIIKAYINPPITDARVGEICYFARNSAPTGFLKANGALVSRTAYAALYAAIGTMFGVGDGITTFNLPDLRGEFLRGWDDSRGVDSGRAIGTAQGFLVESHTHASSALPSTNSRPIGSGILEAATGGDATGVYGGAETRPRNIALLACIKF